ncbi:hypothetical protein J7E38_20155 [Bacillus sp. ISL-35]|uniref:hypothetical protein n=1 Tax=Bacillus sp. ISL-35 TaxID=2819122 RepID=UPI001BEA196B|nr:hypothetical protein [Bacillus sp. ISL-35]MBT2681280.1 hypothetical protein [Bacillus sp. ISL-35]MBT2705513.1 hypothetical protein [Chryseobacterium sp. ISL-80]
MMKKLTVIILLLMVSGLFMAACSKSEETKKEAITKVLEHQFTGPDEEFMDLMWNPEYRTVVNEKEENKEFDQYVEEVYGPYFTKSGLDFFIAAMGTQYPTYAYENEYELTLKDVTIKQNEDNQNLYTFVAIVGYNKNGEENTANVKGKVSFSAKAEGKIARFEYGNDDGLSDELRR